MKGYINTMKISPQTIIKKSDIKVGDKFLVEVHGWIMCRDVPSGVYRIEIEDVHHYSQTRLVATFYRPRGRKPLVRHYLEDIMLDIACQNLNGTRIIKKM